jgi:hypothetical protein
MPSNNQEKEQERLDDIIAEDQSRGRKQPKKAISLERSRRIQKACRMLEDKNCSKREFLAAIRAIVPDGSAEFLACAELWERFHGGKL